MNIYQRINEVRKSVSYVQKDQDVGYGNNTYRAVTHDQVTAAVREAMVKQGIVIKPTLTWSAVVDSGSRTSKGATIIRYEARYDVSFINIDEPKEAAVMSVESHANDQGDKAPGKALSYAVKYAMLKMFNLETGENDESRFEGSRREEAMQKHIMTEVNNYIDEKDALGVFLASKRLGEDVWTDVYNSAEDGKKMEHKKKIRALESQGADIYAEINSAVMAGDALGAKQHIEDIGASTKHMLAEKLGAQKSQRLGELIKTLDN